MKDSKNQAKKNVIWLGIVSFLTDVSSEMIFPVLPLFLTIVLGANMAIIGLIEGVAESISSLLKFFSGWLADRTPKKKGWVTAGYSLSALTKPILAIATNWGHVLLVRVADRIGKGIRTAPRDALIADVKKKERGKYFGIHRALDTSGAIVGTLLATLFLALFTQEKAFRIIFLVSVIPGLLAVFFLLWKVKETGKKTDVKRAFLPKMSELSKEFKLFIPILVLFSLANFSYAFFLLRAKDVGIAVALIPIAYLLYNVIYAGSAIPSGRLSDRLGRRNVLIIGYLVFSVMCIGFMFATQALIWLLFAVYGLFMGITDGVSRAYVSDMVGKKIRGSALGFYHMLIGICVLPANFIGGMLWNYVGVKATFIYAAVLSLVAAVLLFVLIRNKNR
ncbi:MAG: MFS transporter [Nanoarchaeota archaeon]|nr:MFS transporter [Nanoarchaeota archaeon]